MKKQLIGLVLVLSSTLWAGDVVDNPMDNIEEARPRLLSGDIRDLIPEASRAVQNQLGYGFTNLHGQDGYIVNTFEPSPFKSKGGTGEDNGLPNAAGTGIYEKPIILRSYDEYNHIKEAPREQAYGTRFLTDYELAFTKFKGLADSGDAEAQFNLGVMYAEGKGVIKNDAEAVRWFKKSADQGLAQAQYNIGYMYYKGKGVTKNKDYAKYWLKKAATSGFTTAQETLKKLGW